MCFKSHKLVQPKRSDSPFSVPEAMQALQRAVDWLRPFVETMGWDYVVVWKLGDDPSQFFEWVGCCCSVCGNAKEKRAVKRQKKMMNPSTPLCRDGYFVHPVKTVACQALSEFPTSMPLYSGIYGDVVITNQFKWLRISPGTSSSDSGSSSVTDSAGTRVLIPVVGGVVELFNSKHIPEERKIVDFMMAQCEFFWKQETESLGSCTDMDLKEQILSNCLRKCSVASIPKCINLTNFVSCAYQGFEGSSSSSNPSSEQTSVGSYSEYVVQAGRETPKQLPRDSVVLDHAKSLFSSDAVLSVKRENTTFQEYDGEHGHLSKNLYAERSRRKRIKDRLLALRAVVPNISKLDKAAVLGDAMVYIAELKSKEKTLQDELNQMEKDDLKFQISCETRESKDLNRIVSSILEPNQQVQIEVNPLSEQEVMIRVLFRQKRGWFSSLTETLLSSSLTITDANITTFNGQTLASLAVEGSEICIKKLRDLLMNVVS